MREVAIIGAGELGGALAHLVARREVVRDIRLIDETDRVAVGKALDIMQAAPIEGFSTTISGSTDVAVAARAAIVVIADRAGGGEWQGGEGLLLLKRLSQLGAAGVILCAGATHRELIEQGVRELGFARERLFGSAPEALVAAARALVALEVDGSPRDVALTILGVPPAHIVLPWEQATIGGLMATRVMDEPARRRISARLAPLWPPGPYTLAAAALTAIESVLGRTRRLVAGFVDPDDSSGRRMRAAALPVRLDASGIVRVEVPALSVHDRIALDNAMLL